MDNVCSQPFCACCVERLIFCDEQFRRYEVFKMEKLKLGAIFATLFKKNVTTHHHIINSFGKIRCLFLTYPKTVMVFCLIWSQWFFKNPLLCDFHCSYENLILGGNFAMLYQNNDSNHHNELNSFGKIGCLFVTYPKTGMVFCINVL